MTKPNSIIGLRLEGGARWSPTQGYFYSDEIATRSGTAQSTDLMLGLSGSLSPLPHSPIAPYGTIGLYARQLWTHGSYAFAFQDSSYSYSIPVGTRTRGDFIGAYGLGIRGRVFGRSFQLEYRRIYNSNGVTFGTRLPF